MEDYLQYVGGVVGAAAVTGAAAVATSVYMAGLPSPLSPPVDLQEQSIMIKGPEGARGSKLCEDGKLVENIYEDARTCFDVLYRGSRVSRNGQCLGWRKGKNEEYSWITYNTVVDKARNFGSGLVEIGLKPGPTNYVGVYSQNCVEWVIAEHGCYHISAVVVPLYDTLGPNACSYVINQADISVVICDVENKVKTLLQEAKQTPNLKQIIVIKDVSKETRDKAEECCIQLFTFQGIEELGKEHHHMYVPPRSSDLATVCYTSGTTGNPKGVMLTHSNLVSCASAMILQMGKHAPSAEDVMISYLPLAHMFERICQVVGFMVGGSIGFFQGDIKLLTDDIKVLKPTFIPAVPRLLNRIYDQVHASVNGNKLKKWLMDMAIQSKQSVLERHIITNKSVWDKLVFKPVQEGLGGRVRLMVTGSAPLASNVLTFLRCALGCMVIEGYGQTECVAPCTVTLQGDYTVGHVGPPLPCCYVKLVDVPEMEYYAINGQGEICVKGNSVFKGYLKEPDKTAETIDKDGWLHTGDIGMWMHNGALRIVDRKKHIFKLAQGEYIAPEKIENIYLSSPFLAQIFVHGESLKACLVGIVVLEKSIVKRWCEEKNISGTWSELCENKVLKADVLKDMTNIGKQAGLKSFEQVKDIYIEPEAFSVDNGLLTPTLKTRRPECRKYYFPQIEAMYQCLA